MILIGAGGPVCARATNGAATAAAAPASSGTSGQSRHGEPPYVVLVFVILPDSISSTRKMSSRMRRLVGRLRGGHAAAGGGRRVGPTGIAPGLWKVTTTTILNGAIDAAAGQDAMPHRGRGRRSGQDVQPRISTVNSSCERTEYQLDRQRLRWRLQCKGQIDMDVAGEFTFESSAALYRDHRDQGLNARADHDVVDCGDRGRAYRRMPVAGADRGARCARAQS